MKWNHSVFHVRETINNYYVRISGILYLIVQWKFENSRLLEILGFSLTRSSKNVSIVFIVVSTFSSKPWFFFFFFASRNIQNKTKQKRNIQNKYRNFTMVQIIAVGMLSVKFCKYVMLNMWTFEDASLYFQWTFLLYTLKICASTNHLLNFTMGSQNTFTN